MAADIPVIDIAPWRSGDAAEMDTVAAAIDDACRRTGFLHLAGHSIPAATVDGLLGAMDSFFDLPVEQKRAVRSPSPEINRGYAPSGAEGLGYSLGTEASTDLFEAYNVGPHDADPTIPAVADEIGGVFAANLWPTADEHPAPDDFQGAVTTYFEAVRRQAHELTDILARALGLLPHHFQPFTTHSTDILRLVNYQIAPTDPAADERLGMGAHTDYGICTLLLADAVPGLEVLLPDRGWAPVEPKPGHLLVNLGDLLAQWTNDRWRSTLHRVQPPAPGRRRRSAAFFHDGNHDALIECLPTCMSADEPPKYPPVVAGDHVRAKLLGPRTLRASTATSTLGDRVV